MMVRLILDSITRAVRQKLTNQESIITVGTPPVRSGKLILKLIMNKTIISTKTTSASFRADFINLESLMSSCNSNIEIFNNHFDHDVGSFQARGEQVDDLLTNLFKGYNAATDVKVVSNINL